MRRGGWAIHMAPKLGGSYEESPPTLSDFAARDRRWCQGNLQLLALLPTRGFHWVSRLHLLTGIGSYLTAPLWLTFLVSGILVSLQAQFVRPEYFPKGYSLFPQWPEQDPIWRPGYLWARWDVDRAKAARLSPAADRSRHTEQIRWQLSGAGRHHRRDDPLGPNRACHDDLPILRRQ
jgi:hypothetical protein